MVHIFCKQIVRYWNNKKCYFEATCPVNELPCRLSVFLVVNDPIFQIIWNIILSNKTERCIKYLRFLHFRCISSSKKSRPKAVQNQILVWMTKTSFRSTSWDAQKQFLGVKKQLLDAKKQLLATKRLVLGNSTGWSIDRFGHPIQKLVLDSFWMTYFSTKRCTLSQNH